MDKVWGAVDLIHLLDVYCPLHLFIGIMSDNLLAVAINLNFDQTFDYVQKFVQTADLYSKHRPVT